jgi:hypothetical protein
MTDSLRASAALPLPGPASEPVSETGHFARSNSLRKIFYASVLARKHHEGHYPIEKWALRRMQALGGVN